MDDIVKISDYFVSLRKDNVDKVSPAIKWVEDKEANLYVFRYHGVLFSKSLDDNDPNYCYLNYKSSSHKPNQIFETKNCLIAYILAFFH